MSCKRLRGLKLSCATFTFFGLIACSGFYAADAMAGAMPDKVRNEASSILDRALKDIQDGQTGEAVDAPEDIIPPDPVGLTEEDVEQVIAEPPIQPPEPEPEPEVVEAEEEPAPAPENRTIHVMKDNTAYFGLSVGLYDSVQDRELAGSLGLEYQSGRRLAGFLQPIFGAFATTDATNMVYGGVGVPISMSKNWMVLPSITAGYYDGGNGVDLGRRLAYRLGTEIAYVLENKSRIGLNIHTITNGTSPDSNDRTEIISIRYTTPLDEIPFIGKPKASKNTQ